MNPPAASLSKPPSLRRWKTMRNLGIFLACGPLWGKLGTVLGMILSFEAMAESEGLNPGSVSEGISVALYSTMVGMVACPIGVILIVIAVKKITRIETESSLSPAIPQTPPHIPSS